MKKKLTKRKKEYNIMDIGSNLVWRSFEKYKLNLF